VTKSSVAAVRSGPTNWPTAGIVSVALALILVFVLVGFPWDSLARRLAWQISAAIGGSVSIESLSPALTQRGPVLRARQVVVDHPAIARVRLEELELAPRWSSSWFTGEPTLRIWAKSELGLVDGVFSVGEVSSFIGRVQRVELAKLPLRLDGSGVRLSGRLDADAEISLDRKGSLLGRVAFSSPSLVIHSDQLPMPIAFSHAEGVILILENGATQIESVSFEGELIEGELSGEIGLVHRSESPPIDFQAEFRIVNPILRGLAPGAGIPISADGGISVRISGTLDAPRFEALSEGARPARRPPKQNRK